MLLLCKSITIYITIYVVHLAGLQPNLYKYFAEGGYTDSKCRFVYDESRVSEMLIEARRRAVMDRLEEEVTLVKIVDPTLS